MPIIAELSIASSEFILGQVLARDPNTHIEMERVVPASKQVMPYIWVSGTDLEQFRETVEESPYVESITPLEDLSDAGLYRVDWAAEVESLIYGIAETDATILEAEGGKHWLFRLRFEDRSGLAAFQDYCIEHEISFSLERVHNLGDAEHNSRRFDLTDTQHDMLVRAVQTGYFEVPRRTTLAELGAAFDVTQQTSSENVRRATDKVLRAALFSPESVGQNSDD